MEFKILEEAFKGEEFDSIFEIGCANGGLLADIRKEYPNAVVGGMDISRSIQGSKDRFPDCSDKFVQGDITEEWPYADKSYDIVFSVGVLMYIFDPLKVIREMCRVAKKKLILIEYHHIAVGPCGQLVQGYIEGDKMQTGIIRNYMALFQILKIPMEINFIETNIGKTIIKCTLK